MRENIIFNVFTIKIFSYILKKIKKNFYDVLLGNQICKKYKC